jgi:hypothetical protein
VPLDSGASAVVHVMPQRRGSARVLLYLASPTREVFAAEFEGADAAATAEAAAARLNEVLRTSAPASARVEAEPPPAFRWMAWSGVAVTGLLIAAGYRGVRSRASAG